MSDDLITMRESELNALLAEAREDALTDSIHAAIDIMESESMLWLMAGSNHQESQLANIRSAWRVYCDQGGKTWPSSTRDYGTGERIT